MSGAILGAASVAAFSPTQNSYSSSGSFTETIPSGANTVLVEVWGGSGAGGAGTGSGCGALNGGGGASGGYSKASFSVIGHNIQTIAVTVGVAGVGAGVNGGQSKIAAGSFTPPNLCTGNGGGGGGTGGGAGSAGTASGGTTNTSGNPGGPGGVGSRTGGAAIAGTNGTGHAGGNGGLDAAQIARTDGGIGLVIFSYT